MTDEGSGFGEMERFFGDLVSFWVGPCLVSLGVSWVVGVSLDGSSMAGGSAFTDVFSCFSNGGRGSGSGIVGMGKSLQTIYDMIRLRFWTVASCWILHVLI